MRRLILLLTAAAVLPAYAAPVRLKGGAKSEESLRRFVERDAQLAARLKDAVRREKAFAAAPREPVAPIARETDLRDALSDAPDTDLQAALEKSSGAKRRALIETLPGMKDLMTGPTCATLAACDEPAMALEVTDSRGLSGSLRRMVRPWVTLQRARGSELELSSVNGPGDAALSVTLKGVDAPPLILNVSPHELGGYSVWFDRPEDAAALYERERRAVLSRRSGL